MARTAALSRRLHALAHRAERLDAEPRAEAIPADRAEFAVALGINPDPWQRDLLRSDADRVLLNGSRQSGKSTMAAVVALHRALTVPGSLALCLAPSERQSKELFARVAGFYRGLAYAAGARAPESDRKLGMVLANGSRIEALPGTERTIRGFSDVDVLIVDEAARVSDELYHAARPMLAVSGGTMLLLSTPHGQRGAFFEEWAEGVGWERYRIPASECPRIPEAFLEEERRSLPGWVYRQEYLCEFAETDDAVFARDLVMAAVTSDVAPLFEEAG